MNVEVREEPMTALRAYSRVPIAFEVDRIFDVLTVDKGLGGFVLSERQIEVPYVKDYDAIEGEGPARWAERFDVSNWGLISAHAEGGQVGGVTVAFNTPSVDMLEGRSDLAVLWDIRVRPGSRGRGVGSALFQAAERWAVDRGCRQLKIETQNINVAACKFYVRHGCALGAVHRFAYVGLSEEVQLLWYKTLLSRTPI